MQSKDEWRRLLVLLFVLDGFSATCFSTPFGAWREF